VAVVGELPEMPQEPALPARPAAMPRERRRVYLAGEWRPVPVLDLEALAPGQAIEGPAIVEAATTTVLMRGGERAVVTSLGWLDITVG
jgi:N-methylhydantoinase A